MGAICLMGDNPFSLSLQTPTLLSMRESCGGRLAEISLPAPLRGTRARPNNPARTLSFCREKFGMSYCHYDGFLSRGALRPGRKNSRRSSTCTLTDIKGKTRF